MNSTGNIDMQDVTAITAAVSGGAVAYKAGELAETVETTSLISSYPQLPIILQVVGAFVGIAGILIGFIRLYQNHLDRKLKREIHEWEKLHASSTKAGPEEATSTTTQTTSANQQKEE